MSGTAHIVIHPDLRPALDAVATVISARDFDVGANSLVIFRIESSLLPAGYNGVMSPIVRDGRVVSFKRDEDV
jgi:hypothetical protein